MRLLLRLSLIIAVMAVLMYSSTQNCTVYEMSENECVIFQSLFNIFHHIFIWKEKLFGDSYNNTSNEYKAFKQILKLLQWYDNIHDINMSDTKELVNYMRKRYQRNNLLQYIVPIPKSTNISSGNIKWFKINTRILWIIGDNNIDNSTTAKTIVYIHGGAYIYGGPSHLGFVSRLSIATQTRIVYICYNTPPVNATEIPAQVDQILFIYYHLALNMEIDSNKIIIIGDGAGAGLALLTIQRLGKNNLDSIYPSGVISMSAWIDLELKSKSYINNEENDILNINEFRRKSVQIITGNNETKLNKSSYSPLFGKKLSKLPAMYFIVSKDETSFDDTQHIINKLNKDSNNTIDLKYDIIDYMFHSWILFLDIFPEANKSFATIVKVINDWYIPSL